MKKKNENLDNLKNNTCYKRFLFALLNFDLNKSKK